MRLWDRAAALVEGLDHILLPGECLLCQAPMPIRVRNELVCPLCHGRWSPVVPPWCNRCGQPGLIDVACRFCPAWPDALGRVRSAVWLAGNARESVHHLKYEGWPGVARTMAKAMKRLEVLVPGAWLVPVPLSRRRMRQRGYNQAEQLAAALGDLTGLPLAHALARQRDARSQTALAPEARVANVAGAFVASAKVPGTLVLVDDVCTTGATLGQAAVALVTAGATRVDAVTFARAPLPVELAV